MRRLCAALLALLCALPLAVRAADPPPDPALLEFLGSGDDEKTEPPDLGGSGSTTTPPDSAQGGSKTPPPTNGAAGNGKIDT